MAYGIANRTGKPTQDEATKIVAAAWEGGVRFFDTAQAYGDSEVVLGRALRHLGLDSDARMVSKFHPCLSPDESNDLYTSVQESLDRTGIPRLWGIMLHDENWLDHMEDGVGPAISRCRRAGLIRYCGVSAYNSTRALQALSCPEVDFVQFPFNILDHRLIDDGILNAAFDNDKLLFIRSIFLQGLFFMEGDQLPKNMLFAREYIDEFTSISERSGQSMKSLAMGFVRSLAGSFPIVIGAESESQIRQTLDIHSGCTCQDETAGLVRVAFQNVPGKLIDPTQWAT